MNIRIRIKQSLARMAWIGSVLLILAEYSVGGAGFRLSFIDEKTILEDTCQLLKEDGFSEDSVAKFKKLVEDHNRPGNRVDRAKFPPLQYGYYHFQDFPDFTNRMARAFYETPGSDLITESTLMCFDVAGLLLRGSGCEAPYLENDFVSKKFISFQRDRSLAPASLEPVLHFSRRNVCTL